MTVRNMIKWTLIYKENLTGMKVVNLTYMSNIKEIYRKPVYVGQTPFFAIKQ